MKTSILLISGVVFLACIFCSCGENRNRISEDTFLGEWYTIKGDVESYSFLKDEKSYIFVGIIGMRPVVYGTWKVDKDVFVITMDNGTSTEYSYNLSNDTLTFNDGLEVYTRTEPLDVKYPEVQILTNISSDFIGLKFSSPQPADLYWGYWNDSTQSIVEFTLKGYSISAGSMLSSGDTKEISEYLMEFGFEPDTSFISEICSAYWDVNQIVTLCTLMDDEATNDSIIIHISSGLIVK